MYESYFLFSQTSFYAHALPFTAIMQILMHFPIHRPHIDNSPSNPSRLRIYLKRKEEFDLDFSEDF